MKLDEAIQIAEHLCWQVYRLAKEEESFSIAQLQAMLAMVDAADQLYGEADPDATGALKEAAQIIRMAMEENPTPVPAAALASLGECFLFL